MGEPDAAARNASREASEWFVFLQDDPTDAGLRRRFEQWLGASSEHAAAWAATLRASSLAESLLPFDARDWADTSTLPKSKSKPRRRWLLPLMMSAAAAALLIIAAPAVVLRFQSDHSTSVGQVRDVALADGSIVTLAPSSAIAVSYSDRQRQVHLLSGEAFFSVKPNAGRPFRVMARAVRASALGTSFDVRLETRAVGVSVSEGKVQVESAGATELLVAGEAILLANDTRTAQRRSLLPQAVGAWRQGQLIMEDGPLGAAVEQLERSFDGTIILADGSLAERPVTGVFDLHDPEASLRAMAKALGLRVRKVTPWVLIVSAS
jgi:transmembrane sensor